MTKMKSDEWVFLIQCLQTVVGGFGDGFINTMLNLFYKLLIGSANNIFNEVPVGR